MGWFGDQIILGQKPRKNGCICTLLPVLLTLGVPLAALTHQVVT